MNTQSPPVRRDIANPELDREYNARASVVSFEAEHAKYVAVSAQVQRKHRRLADILYDASGETLDLYPAGAKAPLFLWIHGGYWRASSKDDNAFVVAGLIARGFAVAVMNYTLAPEVTLDEIVRQTRAAVAFLHRRRTEFGLAEHGLTVGGSSAGGHLVGMLLAEGWHADFGVPDDAITTALALSGLHEIAPLRHTHVNAWLGLDDASIARNSPILHIPARSTALLLTSVGGRETSEFRRQTVDYTARWIDAGHRAELIPMPDYNHFDIALSLSEPNGVLTSAVAAAAAASLSHNR